MKKTFGMKLRAAPPRSQPVDAATRQASRMSIGTMQSSKRAMPNRRKKTLENLTRVLGVDIEASRSVATTEHREASLQPAMSAASLEEMLREIDRRGFTVTIAPKF